MSEHYVMNQLVSVTPATADEAQGRVLERVQKQVGFIPNMYSNMVNSPALLEAYLHGYELFRTESGFSASEQEVILLAISTVNGCSYCMAAHSMIADKMSKVPAPVLEAIRQGKAISDPRLSALFAMTCEMVNSRGRPSIATTTEFLNNKYTEKHLLDILLAIAVKTLSNYSNHLFNTPVDAPFSAYRIS